eukprot:1160133-Pelagomonas_calceolata.AAC.4
MDRSSGITGYFGNTVQSQNVLILAYKTPLACICVACLAHSIMIVSSNSGEGHKNRKAVPGYEEIHGPHFYGRQAVGRQLRKHCALILNASLHALAFSGRAALVVDALGALLRARSCVCVCSHVPAGMHTSKAQYTQRRSQL